MKVDYVTKAPAAAAVLVLFVGDDRKLQGQALALDRDSNSALSRALAAPRFTAKRGQLLDVLSPSGLKQRRILLVGLGASREVSVLAAREIGAAIVAHLQAEHEPAATVIVDLPTDLKLEAGSFAANLALGAKLRNYRFSKYKNQHAADDPKPLKSLQIVTTAQASAKKAATRLEAVGNGVELARDLINEPPVALYPETFVQRAKELTKLGVEVKALDEKDMAKLGMGGMLAVGNGSKHPPRLLILRWKGGKKGEQPVA
ncbi:MAG TPA: M17 family peptidase N-terminal domain-containing protein, partial [Dongiaceae bacterium]